MIKIRRPAGCPGCFITTRNDKASEITVAVTGDQQEGLEDGRLQVHLKNGRLYRLQRSSMDDELVNYTKLVRFHDDPEVSIGYKRKAAATSSLLASDQPVDIAEVQWRLSRPMATLLLALIAIPLSRSSPRQGKNEKTFMAAVDICGLLQSQRRCPNLGGARRG